MEVDSTSGSFCENFIFFIRLNQIIWSLKVIYFIMHSQKYI